MNARKFGFFFLLFIILLLAAKLYLVARGYLPALAAGVVLGYIFHPIFVRLSQRLGGRPGLAAFLTILLFLIAVLGPAALVAFRLQDQVQEVLGQQSTTTFQSVVEQLDQRIREWLPVGQTGRPFLQEHLPRLLEQAQSWGAALASGLVVGLAGFVISLFVSLFVMFYVMVQRDKLLAALHKYFPLSGRNMDRLLKEMGADCKNLVLGQLIIAIIQGGLAAVGFLIFGVPGVVLWGIVMIVLSFIPFLGSFLIWMPAAVILLFQGETFNGVGLIIWGAVVVGLSDNLVRPKLTSVLGKMHPLTVLLGVFIGLSEWGFMGLVLGPLLISVTLHLTRMFYREYLGPTYKQEAFDGEQRRLPPDRPQEEQAPK